MNDSQTCLGHDLLTAYVYDECTLESRTEVEAHVGRCVTCRRELDDLRAVRRCLAAWSPPEPALGVRVVAGSAPRRTRVSALARWALPAAAVLVLAAAAAAARIEIRSDGDALVIRTGWQRPGAPVSVEPSGPPVTVEAPWRGELIELERQLREELAADRAVTGAASEADVLRRVRLLIEESERRQQRELALRMTQLVRDFDSQRQTDLIRIEQGLSRLEGMTGAEVAQQRALLNYLVRVSSPR